MDREKITLFVNGNILCRDVFRTTTETDFNNVTPNAVANDFDLSDAIIVAGNLVTDGMDIKSHKIACAGVVIAYSGSMPLSERLTKEEKEKIRESYKELSECIEEHPTDVEYLKGKRCQLAISFGPDLFNT